MHNKQPIVFGVLKGGGGFSGDFFCRTPGGCFMSETHKKATHSYLSSEERYRKNADTLRRRMALLEGEDAILMKMFLETGASYRQMSRLLAVNEVTLARRIRAMTTRLVSGQYLDCLGHRRKLDEMELKVAKDYYLKGLPIRSIAAKRGWSFYRIAGTIGKIRHLIGETLRGTNTH